MQIALCNSRTTALHTADQSSLSLFLFLATNRVIHPRDSWVQNSLVQHWLCSRIRFCQNQSWSTMNACPAFAATLLQIRWTTHSDTWRHLPPPIALSQQNSCGDAAYLVRLPAPPSRGPRCIFERPSSQPPLWRWSRCLSRRRATPSPAHPPATRDTHWQSPTKIQSPNLWLNLDTVGHKTSRMGGKHVSFAEY